MEFVGSAGFLLKPGACKPANGFDPLGAAAIVGSYCWGFGALLSLAAALGLLDMRMKGSSVLVSESKCA